MRILCSFCNAQLPYNILELKDFRAGWGKVILVTQGINIEMIHCPNHSEEFCEVLQRKITERKENL